MPLCTFLPCAHTFDIVNPTLRGSLHAGGGGVGEPRFAADETSIGSVAAVEASVVAGAGEVVSGGDVGPCVEAGAGGGCEGGAAEGGKSGSAASGGSASCGIVEGAASTGEGGEDCASGMGGWGGVLHWSLRRFVGGSG